MTRRKAAALAGVAPHLNDSGQKQGYRKIRGGRPEVRSTLFMPALRVAAGHGEFAAFYKRLIANGKKANGRYRRRHAKDRRDPKR
jgi:transposase